MSAYVLIVILYYDRAISMQEFTNKEKCEAAIAVISKDYKSNYVPNRYYCVEK